MRIYERSIYLSSSLFLILKPYTIFSYIFLLLSFVLIATGNKKEGLRIAEMPCIICTIIHFWLGEIFKI